MDILSYALSKKFTEDTAIGLGAVKGAPCTISSIQDNGDSTTLTFKWTGTDGTVQSSTMTVKNGISITDVSIDETTNILACTFSDGTTQEAGKVNVTTTANKIEYTTTKDASITNVKGALDKAMDINVDTLEYENNVDATINSVKGALDKLMVKTDSELEAPLTPNVQMGTLKSSYPKGTPLEEIIRDMLTEKIAPKVTLSISPSKMLYDIVTESISSLTINATVTKQTYDVAKITYYINDTVVKENTSNVTNGGSFPYIYNTEINDTVIIKVVVEDKEGLKTTVTKTIEFYPVIYYGIVDAETGEPTEAMIKTLSSKLQNTKVFTYEGITTDWGKVCVAIPKKLGTISQIVDPINALSYNSSFSSVTVNVNGYDYSVLTQIDPSAASGITLKFS